MFISFSHRINKQTVPCVTGRYTVRPFVSLALFRFAQLITHEACGRTRAARAHTAHTRDFRHIRLKRSHRGRWDAVFLLGSRGCDTSLIYPSKYPQQKGVPPEIGQISGAAVELNAQREHRGLVM